MQSYESTDDSTDYRDASFDAERPFIELLEQALEQPVEKRHAFVRANCRDVAIFEAALQCLDAMGELGESFHLGVEPAD